MGPKPTLLFLVHRETGQRYPVNGDVLIGRTSGDIVFSRDTRLSQQHVQVSPGEECLVVFDLNSANGTFIDGQRLTPERAYILRPGSELAMGTQLFTADALSPSKRLRRSMALSRRKGKAKNQPSLWITLMLLAAGLGLVWLAWKEMSPISRPHEPSLIREINEVFERYSVLQKSVDEQSASAKEVAQRIQIQVVNRLNNLGNRADHLEQFETNARDHRKLVLEQIFIRDLSLHAKSRMHYLITADIATQEELDRLDDQLEQSAADFRQLSDGRSPAAIALPTLVPSPLLLVEKEMRRALAAYRILGKNVHEQRISEREMAATIRANLTPKLNAVAAKLGVIKPENRGEKQRLALEIKIVAAFLAQLKAIANYAASHETKYNAETERWSAQIQKLNLELKNQILRQPAAR